MNTLQAITFNILGGILGAVGIKYYMREEQVYVQESDQDVLYRKQREYMRTNHW